MPERQSLLLVDDDPGFRKVYRKLLSASGYDVSEAADAPTARKAFDAGSFDLVILDLMLPPSGLATEGEALAAHFAKTRPEAKLIVTSGSSDNRLALRLVQHGAYDFITKPVDPDVLLAVLNRAWARLSLERRVHDLEQELAQQVPDFNLLGSSTTFTQAKDLSERVAPTEVPVLLTGQTGTGKEVFARHIHAKSRRASGKFLPINCGALPDNLLESLLFGHKKGAFTGALKDSPGLFVEAHGGTVFLDELGDMAPQLQVKLLRVLESGEVLPIGASAPVSVDVRLISATHKPLKELIAAGEFREDLYYRLCGIEVELPKLQDRTGDLPLLAAHFLNHAKKLVPASGGVRISPAAMRRLEDYSWPGNLRQLRHEMQRALVFAAGTSEIEVAHLSPEIAAMPPGAQSGAVPTSPETLEDKIALLEQQELRTALERNRGNKTKTAQQLGLSRQGLLNKLARYGIGGEESGS